MKRHRGSTWHWLNFGRSRQIIKLVPCSPVLSSPKLGARTHRASLKGVTHSCFATVEGGAGNFCARTQKRLCPCSVPVGR